MTRFALATWRHDGGERAAIRVDHHYRPIAALDPALARATCPSLLPGWGEASSACPPWRRRSRGEIGTLDVMTTGHDR